MCVVVTRGKEKHLTTVMFLVPAMERHRMFVVPAQFCEMSCIGKMPFGPQLALNMCGGLRRSIRIVKLLVLECKIIIFRHFTAMIGHNTDLHSVSAIRVFILFLT